MAARLLRISVRSAGALHAFHASDIVSPKSSMIASSTAIFHTRDMDPPFEPCNARPSPSWQSKVHQLRFDVKEVAGSAESNAGPKTEFRRSTEWRPMQDAR